MADIRTRQVNKGSIKSIDRAANLSGRVRIGSVRTKEEWQSLNASDERGESAYAGDNILHIAGEGIRGSGRVTASGVRKLRAGTSRSNFADKKNVFRVERGAALIRGARGGARDKSDILREGTVISRHENDISRDFRLPKMRGAASKNRSALSASGKRIKTAGRAAMMKQVQQAKKAEQARRLQVAARRTAERTARETRCSAIILYHALKRAIVATKTLMLSMALGGWIVLLIVLICTLFGAAFYFFGDGSSSNYTPVSAEVEAYTAVIEKYAGEYGIPEYVDLIKAVMMQESGGRGKDPMQAAEGAFNTKYPKTPNGIKDPNYSIRCGVQELKAALESAKVENPLDMERIRLALQGYNYGNGYIAWAIKRDGGYTVENASVFFDEQAKKHGWKSYGDKQYVAHVLRYYPYGNYNMGIGNTKITQVAARQVGNQGGKKFWSWYGFKNRVEWCACYVSWCADQCGYIKEGIIPRFSYCPTGINWFKDKNQWQGNNYKPAPGDIIFFDWGGDGVSDHVGIVEKCDGTTVYTIEGNSGDQCAKREYSVGSRVIMGYGVPKY